MFTRGCIQHLWNRSVWNGQAVLCPGLCLFLENGDSPNAENIATGIFVTATLGSPSCTDFSLSYSIIVNCSISAYSHWGDAFIFLLSVGTSWRKHVVFTSTVLAAVDKQHCYLKAPKLGPLGQTSVFSLPRTPISTLPSTQDTSVPSLQWGVSSSFILTPAAMAVYRTFPKERWSWPRQKEYRTEMETLTHSWSRNTYLIGTLNSYFIFGLFFFFLVYL